MSSIKSIPGLILGSQVPVVVVICVSIAFLNVGGCGRQETQSESEPLKTAPTPSDRQASDSAAMPQPLESEPEVKLTVETPAVDPVALRDAAMLALQDGDDDTAYQLVRQAVRMTPDDPQLIFVNALVLGKRNRFPEAIQMLDDLAENVPETRLPALGQTADWMVQFGQYTDAETRYRQLLDIAPNAALVRRQLATLLVRQGRRIDAIPHLRYLCELGDIQESELRTLLSVAAPIFVVEPDRSFDPIGPLGRARDEVAGGNWQSARESLEDLDPISPEEFALLGRIYVESNDFDALAKRIDRLPESANQYPDAWFARGALAAHQGNHSDAVKSFAEALRLDQTDEKTYLRISQSLDKLKLSDENKAAAQRAELINKTHRLGSEMAAMEQPNDQSLSSLVQLLRELRRPHEAIAWRGIQLAYAQQRKTLSQSEVEQALAEIATERSKLRDQTSDQRSEAFVLCGIDVDALPENPIPNAP